MKQAQEHDSNHPSLGVHQLVCFQARQEALTGMAA
jgi:hypothetical protein